VRRIFQAPTTTVRERKQLLRALIAEVVVTVNPTERTAELRIVWQGGQATELTMALNRVGGHFRATDEDTVALVRRLAVHYDDTQIALILARQHRRTGTGLAFTRARVASLRVSRGIPACEKQPVVPAGDDAVVVGVVQAERLLGVSKVTIYRWIKEGFIVGEQLTPAGPGTCASTTPSAPGSSPRCPRGGCAWTRPPRRWGWPARRCCIGSNAASCMPCTSTAAGERACVSRSNATRLDC
jgi:hypothetical protein